MKRDNKKQKRKTRKLHERIHPRHSTHRTKKISEAHEDAAKNQKTKTKRKLYFAFKN